MDWMLFTGFCTVIFIIFFIKSLAVYKIYQNSFYEHIYSNFVEFYIKFKYRKNLSQSGWLNQEIGTHRILFNSYLNNKKEVQEEFVTIFSQYGISIFCICNIQDSIIGQSHDSYWINSKNDVTTRFHNPSTACDNQIKHIKECVPNSIPITLSILFPDNTNISKIKSKYPLSNFTNYRSIITDNNAFLSKDVVLNCFNNSIERNIENA